MAKRYLIGEVSKILKMSVHTLRYYDKLNLLSPKKDTISGYRYYTLEDIITLTYLKVFKDMELPLEQIKYLLGNSNLQELKEILGGQLQVIDQRIDELVQLKKTVQSYHRDIGVVEEKLGVYEIKESPFIIYKEISGTIDASYLNCIEELEASEGVKDIFYSIIVPREEVRKEEVQVFYAVSGLFNEATQKLKGEGFVYLQPRKCVHTVIRVEEDEVTPYLETLTTYLAKQKLQIVGDTICRAIAFEHHNGQPIDYYQVWIPVA